MKNKNQKDNKLQNKKMSFYQKYTKRAFDFTLSLIGLIVLSPILLIVYVLSAIILKGNPIFKQYRPGKDGKIFAFYKFRSMTNKKDKDGFLLPDAQRITKWGKFLRRTSLDEILQIVNIVKGDMSIIGPRPRLVKDFIFYDKDVMQAYSVRPGLTGPAQVYDRNSESAWEEVFKRDLDYANNVTFKNDCKMFFKTFTAVLQKGSISGSNSESKVQKREYYYADQLLKDNKISQQQYNDGLKQALEIENSKTIKTIK